MFITRNPRAYALMLDSLIAAHKLTRVVAMLILVLAFTQRLVMAAEPAISSATTSLNAPPGDDPTPKDGVLDKMATRIIKLILIFMGAAAAVMFSIVGVRILVSSAVQSSYGMAQGILARQHIEFGSGQIVHVGDRRHIVRLFCHVSVVRLTIVIPLSGRFFGFWRRLCIPTGLGGQAGCG